MRFERVKLVDSKTGEHAGWTEVMFSEHSDIEVVDGVIQLKSKGNTVNNQVMQAIIKWNQDAGNTIDQFNVRQSALYMGLQCEELAEKMLAFGFKGQAAELSALGTELKKGLWDQSVARGDRLEMLDGDCDLIVVSIGAAISQGADIIGAMQEVQASNDSKRFADGELHKDANGKILKGDRFWKPDLSKFLLKV